MRDGALRLFGRRKIKVVSREHKVVSREQMVVMIGQ